MFVSLNIISICAFVGFPRTREQAEELFATEPVNAALNLIVPFEIIIERVKGRWIHEPSGRIYNTEYSPPKIMVKYQHFLYESIVLQKGTERCLL
jgi:adenylate kinase family enzyme